MLVRLCGFFFLSLLLLFTSADASFVVVRSLKCSHADATGAEKIQLTLEFYHGPSLSEGPFGTLDSPVIVRAPADVFLENNS